MYQDSEEFNQLVQIYTQGEVEEPIGLYLGAGINLPAGDNKTYFDTYTWEGLLRAIYQRNMIQYSRSFEKLKSRYQKDWPKLAEALIRNMGVEKLVHELDLIFYHCLPREDEDGRLSKRMLDQAPTLHAAICFTAAIHEQTENSWTFKRNHKIHTIITPNYDFFFGAGWTRYQTFDNYWKVNTPFRSEDSDDPTPRQRTINYIHGYLPYRLSYRKELVLTKSSYDNAYKTGGFARRILEEAIARCHLIFIGTSFDDQHVNSILSDAMKNRASKSHFSIEKSPNAENIRDRRKMGINVIPVNDFSEISCLLEELYSKGLDSSNCEKFGLSNQEYWKRLWLGPEKQPAASLPAR